MKNQLFSGARGRIEFIDSDGGKHTLAFVTDVSINETASLRPSYCIGNVGPITIEPMSMDVTASIGRIIPINADSKKNEDTAIDRKLEEKIDEILTKSDLTITIYDTKSLKDGVATETILASVKHARFAGRSTSMSTGDVASERYQFVGIFDAGYGGTSNTHDKLGYDDNAQSKG